eukprot:Rmarinus@m.12685
MVSSASAGTFSPLGVELFAVADGAVIESESAGTTEDVVANATIRPMVIDTDGSEIILKVVTRAAVPLLFPGVHDTFSAWGATSMVYTLSAAMVTGFADNTAVLGFGVFPPADCDVDLTLTVHGSSLEANGLEESPGETVSLRILLDAAADEPVAYSSPVTPITEDMSASFLVTPSLIRDTDGSENLLYLHLESLADGVDFSVLNNTITHRSGIYVSLEHEGTGFKSDVAIPGFSVSPPAQCDIDFYLTLLCVAVELNGSNMRGSNSVSSVVVVSASADTPDLFALPSVTGL